ncbi:hypothetical protein MNEG_4262 [Monoraphidium neglectum]|uniref:Uncharacterized protein n=1 Tax=Monoraphidium neglectum TaxID=145388 RepID=A0A0D2LAA4_9CHLO|nr:hypothetical protein MNEG_4262 [Monoraphidium neglectum]KIZ03699.1 hypothetical protein MNEG_4262 [Monoraphidium neglectum]|eukprot:XP_013902718.1 hypothetical protein MNEG_4262 [Monoraphidium neglectum]
MVVMSTVDVNGAPPSRRWHEAARRRRFERARERLARRLILLRPGMRGALMEARARLREVGEAGATGALPGEGLYRLESLVQAQQEHHRGRLALLMARNMSAIAAAAQQLAGQITRGEAALRAQVEEFDRDPSAGAMKGANPIKVKADREAAAALHRSALEEAQLLPGFLRLLDCLVLQSHLDLVISAVEGVRSHLMRPDVHARVAITVGREGAGCTGAA